LVTHVLDALEEMGQQTMRVKFFEVVASQFPVVSSSGRFGFCIGGCLYCIVHQFNNSPTNFLLREDHFPLTLTLSPIREEGKAGTDLRRSRQAIRWSCGIVEQQLLRSGTRATRSPACRPSRTAANASWALRPGRNPKEQASKSASKTGSITTAPPLARTRSQAASRTSRRQTRSYKTWNRNCGSGLKT